MSINAEVLTQAARVQPQTSSQERASDGYEFHGFGTDGPTFFDILDMINPLQHIPVISTIYRELTGDEIDPIPEVIGGGIFGGITGAIGSAINVVVKEITGHDIGGHVLAFAKDILGYGEDEAVPDIAVAARPTELTPSAESTVVELKEPSAVAAFEDVVAWARREKAYAATLAAAQSQQPLAYHPAFLRPEVDIRA